FDCVLQIPECLQVIDSGNQELLSFTGPIPQFKRLCDVLTLQGKVSNVAILDSEQPVGHRKSSIEIGGPFQREDCLIELSRLGKSKPFRVISKCVERRRGHRFQRGIEFLDRRQGFAKFPAQARCGSAHLCQHLLLGSGLALFPSDGLAGRAIVGLQCNQVMTAEWSDGSPEHRFQSLPLANLARNGIGDPLIGRPVHKLKRAANALWWKEVDEWRLLQRELHSLLHCVVEYGIARLVVEVGEQNHVTFAQGGRSTSRKKYGGNHCCDYDSGCGNQNLRPAMSFHYRRRRDAGRGSASI